MFEKATRMKLRFTTEKGYVSVEDIWDMPLTQLDELAKSLNKKLKESAEESFIKVKSNDDKVIALEFEIVKHVISVKLDETDKAIKARANKEQRDRLLNKLAEKQDAELDDLSTEEIKKMIKKLK